LYEDRTGDVMFGKEFENHLRQVILPFWMGLKDDVHGGYIGLVDDGLNRYPDSIKGCILNSRILWFFSACEKALGDAFALCRSCL